MLDTNKLKLLQKKTGLEIEPFCKKINITKTTWYNHIKDGDFKVSHLFAMAKVFGVNVIELFDDTQKEGYNQVANGDNNKLLIKRSSAREEVLEERIKGLEAQLKNKDEMIELLKTQK